jgi:hypothetical protein
MVYGLGSLAFSQGYNIAGFQPENGAVTGQKLVAL